MPGRLQPTVCCTIIGILFNFVLVTVVIEPLSMIAHYVCLIFNVKLKLFETETETVFFSTIVKCN